MKVVLAIGAQMFASTCTALGYATQKRAHMISIQTGKPCLKQFRWWFGLGIMQIGIPMNFIALLWADQSLLCTLAPFSIILSLVLGKYMLKEVIHIQQYISVGLMIIGSILSMFFTSKISHEYKIDEIKRRILSTSSILFLVFSLTMMIFSFIFSYYIIRDITKLNKYYSEEESQNCLLKRQPKAINDNITSTSINDQDNDSTNGVIDESTRIENLEKLKEICLFHNPKWLKFALFTFPWFAGLLSGLLTLITKCVIMLIVHLTEDTNLTSLFTYIMILAMPICGVSFLCSLNLGFKYFDICYVVPIFKASLVFHNTMCGGVLLQEFFIYPAVNLSMYGIGILIIIIGILTMLIPNERSETKNTAVNQKEEISKLLN